MAENSESEQLEEGEIVDDDDFEDISDNSIIDPTVGKFVSSNENLRALSLSSGSETDIYQIVKHKKKLLHRKKHQRRPKKRRLSTDTSDSDISDTCQDLKGKLKEAIHISGIGEIKNPLETRLKAMGGLAPEPAPVPPPPPQLEDSDKIDDNELENLRIEALKTAIINKFHRRKKKKANLDGDNGEKPLETIENKENNTPKEAAAAPSTNTIEKVDTKTPVIDLEEDEDLLRASLLAGLARRITKASENEKNIVRPKVNVIKAKPVPPKLPIKVTPILPKLPANKLGNNNIINRHKVLAKVIQNRPKPTVKPLIINVNDDSDTEEETKKKPAELAQKVEDLKIITNNVEKFLKEQRAKFETETKKRFQIVNKNKTILEKSAVKLLPKSQQLEYQQLLKKLKTAERKKRAKKIALQRLKEAPKTVEVPQAAVAVVSSTVETPSPPKIEIVIQPAIETRSSTSNGNNEKSELSSEEPTSKEIDADTKKSGLTSELTTLQRTLKEIKMHRNGRHKIAVPLKSLQIKSKYQVLTPVIRKITATSNERKKHEQRIKTLLQELNEARNKLAKSHQTFSALVKELVDKKEKIDKSCENKLVKKTENDSLLKKLKGAKSTPVTSTPIRSQSNGSFIEENTLSTIVTTSTNHGYEDMDVCNSDETDMCQIDIVDPNDIDQIFKRKSTVKSAIPEYVSPLNYSAYERYRHVDPNGIMCPYEVNGSCRDIDCIFKHYLKNHERL